jgi:hypothetical protein
MPRSKLVPCWSAPPGARLPAVLRACSPQRDMTPQTAGVEAASSRFQGLFYPQMSQINADFFRSAARKSEGRPIASISRQSRSGFQPVTAHSLITVFLGHSDRPAAKTSSPWHLSAESASYDSPGQSDAKGGASPWVERRLCSCSSAPSAAVGKADCGRRSNGTHAGSSPFYILRPVMMVFRSPLQGSFRVWALPRATRLAGACPGLS